jgi:hypothetical protein
VGVEELVDLDLEHGLRLHHPVEPAQAPAHEVPQVLVVAAHDLEVHVGAPDERRDIADLRPGLERLHDPVVRAALDADEHHRQHRVPELEGIHEGDDPQHAGTLQAVDARPDRALRDVELPGDLAERPAAVLLQLAKDRPVDAVKGLLGPHGATLPGPDGWRATQSPAAV